MFAEMQHKAAFRDALQFGEQYIDGSLERNVFPTDEAIANLAYFEEEFPSGPSSAEAVIEKLNRYGSPATVCQVGGRYFGFVNGGIVPAGLAAKILGTCWDQNPAMYVISPVVSKLETIVQKWLRTIFKLPSSTVAGFVSGTSAANLSGIAAARFRLLKNQGWDVNKKGLIGAPRVRIVAGAGAHSTVVRAITLLGFGRENIDFVAMDDEGRIRADLIPQLDDRTLLILGAGNVNSGAFDDFAAICKNARDAGAWVHIDGAFGLWARAVEKLSHLTNGMEHANSWAVDGHKTLNTPYDCGIVMCSDEEALTSALHFAGDYLQLSEDRDGSFYTPELSRRARVFELWATLKSLGLSGIDQMVYGFHERSRQFARELSAVDGFTIMNRVDFNQTVVTCETDEIVDLVLKEIQNQRVCWVGSSQWKGRRVIRISVCSWATTQKDVTLSVDSFRNALEKVRNRH